MHLSTSPNSRNLPKKFPIGTTYVVEGRGGEAGRLEVSSRYLVLPGGQRINLADDTQAKAARPRTRRATGTRAGSRNGREVPSAQAKKNSTGAGTHRQGRG